MGMLQPRPVGRQGAAITTSADVMPDIAPRLRRHAPVGAPLRIVLIRQGRPAIETSPRTSHREFRSYIDDYEAAGLDPESAPPEELQDLVSELTQIYTSGKPRAHDSAKALAP